MKRVTGGWSKYGGGKQSIIKSKVENTWYCQSCRGEKPKEMSPFLYDLGNEEYIRICAPCLKDGVVILQKRRYEITVREFDKNKPM